MNTHVIAPRDTDYIRDEMVEAMGERLRAFDQGVLHDINDSFVHKHLKTTTVGLKKIAITALFFSAGATLSAFSVVYISSVLVSSLVVVSVVIGAVSLNLWVVAGLTDYDEVGRPGQMTKWQQVREELYLDFLALRKLKEIGADVRQNICRLLPNFFAKHGYARVFNYGLLPKCYSEIFELAFSEMPLNDSVELYRQFEKEQKLRGRAMVYHLNHLGGWNRKFAAEYYDPHTNSLKVPVDELLEQIKDLTLFHGLIDGQIYTQLCTAVREISAVKKFLSGKESIKGALSAYHKKIEQLKKKLKGDLEDTNDQFHSLKVIEILRKKGESLAAQIKVCLHKREDKLRVIKTRYLKQCQVRKIVSEAGVVIPDGQQSLRSSQYEQELADVSEEFEREERELTRTFTEQNKGLIQLAEQEKAKMHATIESLIVRCRAQINAANTRLTANAGDHLPKTRATHGQSLALLLQKHTSPAE